MKIIIEIIDGEIKIISHAESQSASQSSGNNSVGDSAGSFSSESFETIDTGPARLDNADRIGGNSPGNELTIGFSGDVSAGAAPKIA